MTKTSSFQASLLKGRSATSVIHPIVAALREAESQIEGFEGWQSENETAAEFLEKVYATTKDKLASIPEMQTITSTDYEVLNAFLAANGFQIELDPFTPPEFGTASVLKLLLRWANPGVESIIHVKDNQYSAVQMRSAGSTISFGTIRDNETPVAIIPTMTGDEVYVVMEDGVADNCSSLREVGLKIARAASTRYRHREELPGVIFPMVDMNVQPDISWLLGTRTVGESGEPAMITQALQQVRFSMDHVGAAVKSAVPVSVGRSISGPKMLVINKPFFLVVKRPAVNEPIFIGYIAEQHWNKPDLTTPAGK